jgi:DnaJ-domain-containing protein 1
MAYFLFGLAALALGLLLLQGFARANTAVLAQQLRTVGGVTALAAAVAFMIRGPISYAMPLAMLGLWLLKGTQLPFGRTQKSPGQSSRVITEHIEMELDHDTGDMRGRVLKGTFAGRAFESLSVFELSELWQECRFSDVQSASLVEAYLDSAHPTWREDVAEHDRGSQSGGSSGAAVMSREEALDVLGLKPGASEDDIRRAHRDLMMKLHPDRGGSDYLAAKINRAKDVLLAK